MNEEDQMSALAAIHTMAEVASLPTELDVLRRALNVMHSGETPPRKFVRLARIFAGISEGMSEVILNDIKSFLPIGNTNPLGSS